MVRQTLPIQDTRASCPICQSLMTLKHLKEKIGYWCENCRRFYNIVDDGMTENEVVVEFDSL